MSFIRKSFRVLSFSRPFWRENLLVLFLSLLASSLALVNPYLFKVLIDEVFIGEDFLLLFLLVFIFLLSYVFYSFFNSLLQYAAFRLSEKISLRVKRKLFDHVQSLNLNFFHSRTVGDLLSRL